MRVFLRRQAVHVRLGTCGFNYFSVSCLTCSHRDLCILDRFEGRAYVVLSRFKNDNILLYNILIWCRRICTELAGIPPDCFFAATINAGEAESSEVRREVRFEIDL